ncbi:hypothetical protein [Bradyrhizobium ottawaense]
MRDAGDGIRTAPFRGFDCAANRAEEAGGGVLVYQMLLLPHAQNSTEQVGIPKQRSLQILLLVNGNKDFPEYLDLTICESRG